MTLRANGGGGYADATAMCRYSIGDLLRLRPVSDVGDELGIRAETMTVPAATAQTIAEAQPPNTRQLAIGLVTECFSSVDVELLRTKRQELKNIERHTGAQIQEKSGLRGHNLIVTGTRVVVEQAMTLVERALALPISAEDESDGSQANRHEMAHEFRSVQPLSSPRSLPDTLLAEDVVPASSLTWAGNVDLDLTCITPPPGLEATSPPSASLLVAEVSTPLESDLELSPLVDAEVAMNSSSTEAPNEPEANYREQTSPKKRNRKSKAEKKRSQKEYMQTRLTCDVDSLDENVLSTQQSDLSSNNYKLSFPRPRVIEGVKSRKKMILQMTGVSFTYPSKNKATITDVSLAMSQASRIVVVGAKGAGKSTVVKVLTGDHAPTTGVTRRVEGLRIAYVGASTFEDLKEHVQEPPSCHFKRKIAKSHSQKILDTDEESFNFRVMQHLEAFGVSESVRHEDNGPLSRSVKFRIALAVAMWPSPQILILDDPVTHLGREDIDALVEGIKCFNGGVLVTLHGKDQDTFNSVMTEKYVVRGGRLQEDSAFSKAATSTCGSGEAVKVIEPTQCNRDAIAKDDTRGLHACPIKEEIKNVEKMMKEGADPHELSMKLLLLKERLKRAKAA